MMGLKFMGILHKKGIGCRNILVVGTNSMVKKFMDFVKANPELGFNICGLVDDDPLLVGKKLYGYQVLGVLSDIPTILDSLVVDEITFIVPRKWIDRLDTVIKECEKEGVHTTILADFYETKISKPQITDFFGTPVLNFRTIPAQDDEIFFKRLIDLLGSTILLVLMSPVFLFIALAIKLDSRGPVFYRQERKGLFGRKFKIVKFRTMRQNAELEREELMKLNEMSGPVFKIKNDPRITRVGRFLRKTSLDEIPQLINVFKGEMSLVGPRPLPSYEAEQFKKWEKRRQSMKPGITCLWQINGRNSINFDEWIKLDLKYIDTWSLWKDFQILIKTIPAVLMGKGAS